MSRAPGVAPQLCRILQWRMYLQGQDGYREGGSPHSTVPLTHCIPGLGVEKGGANRSADTICCVYPGSRPNCVESCSGGCTNEVNMGTGRVVHPTQRCPPPDISQDWGSKKGERTEVPTRYVPCAWSRAPTVQDLAVEDVLTRSKSGSQRLGMGLLWSDQCWQGDKGDSRDTSTSVTSCPIGMSLPADSSCEGRVP